MEKQKIDMFLAQNAEKLPKEKVLVIKDALEKLDDSKAMFVQTVDFKDPTTVLIISILIGSLGIDRFMLGEAGLGIAKLLTCGGCYIWWIIDMVNAQDRTRQYNYKKLQEALMMQGITIY
jgi:TM2 domain-containing membrane protein YozV